MCLMVYIGLDGPLAGFSDPPEGAFGLGVDPDPRPGALAHKAHVYAVAQYGGSRWCCSCDLYHHHLPWKAETPPPETVSAYRKLREIVTAAQAASLRPELFSCWSGDEGEPVVVEWTVSGEDLVPENNLFDEYEKTGGALPPPSLIGFHGSESGRRTRYLRSWPGYRMTGADEQ